MDELEAESVGEELQTGDVAAGGVDTASQPSNGPRNANGAEPMPVSSTRSCTPGGVRSCQRRPPSVVRSRLVSVSAQPVVAFTMSTSCSTGDAATVCCLVSSLTRGPSVNRSCDAAHAGEDTRPAAEGDPVLPPISAAVSAAAASGLAASSG